jgi:anti-sigma B factor antagonist
MEISTSVAGQVQVVALNGELDGKTAPEVQDQVLMIASEHPQMLLDMRQVSYISSAGLRMLLLLYRHLQVSHGRLALVGLSDRVRDTMETTGFLAHFATFSRMEDALQSLGCESNMP